jgi:hypothetical protein
LGKDISHTPIKEWVLGFDPPPLLKKLINLCSGKNGKYALNEAPS